LLIELIDQLPVVSNPSLSDKKSSLIPLFNFAVESIMFSATASHRSILVLGMLIIYQQNWNVDLQL